jgi:hypothetical protein
VSKTLRYGRTGDERDAQRWFRDLSRYDAFSRLRIASPYTEFDSKLVVDDQPLYWDEVTTGTGSTLYSSQNAAVTLSAGPGVGTAIRQTFQRFRYQPGRTQRFTFTATLGARTQGIKRRIGPCTDNDGIYFEQDEDNEYLVWRSSTSGSPVDTQVPRESWNIDSMTGSGFSGLTIDFTKSHLFFIDFQWFGVGSIMWGVIVDRQVFPIHLESFSNNTVGVYIQTPNLPIRYEIQADGTGPSADLDVICAEVSSEGGSPARGSPNYISTDGTSVELAFSGTTYAVMGLRLKAAYYGASVQIRGASLLVMGPSAIDIEWKVLWNPTITGTWTHASIPDTALEMALGPNSQVSGGTAIAGGHISKGGGATPTADVDALFRNFLKLGININEDDPDELVLVATTLSADNNVDLEVGLSWDETV